jgi:Zn-dependent protease
MPNLGDTILPSGFRPQRLESDPGRSRHPWSWRVGPVLGIDLYLRATFLIILAWVAFSHLAAGHGGRAALEGLVLITAVFAIVVSHELGHALVARRFGVRTRDILLLPIGGIAPESVKRSPCFWAHSASSPTRCCC